MFPRCRPDRREYLAPACVLQPSAALSAAPLRRVVKGCILPAILLLLCKSILGDQVSGVLERAALAFIFERYSCT